jgi:hypothetical protein
LCSFSFLGFHAAVNYLLVILPSRPYACQPLRRQFRQIFHPDRAGLVKVRAVAPSGQIATTYKPVAGESGKID